MYDSGTGTFKLMMTEIKHKTLQTEQGRLFTRNSLNSNSNIKQVTTLIIRRRRRAQSIRLALKGQ